MSIQAILTNISFGQTMTNDSGTQSSKANSLPEESSVFKPKCYFHFDVHHVDIVLNINIGILTIHKLQHVSARCLCIDFLYASLCCETELVMTQMQLSSGGHQRREDQAACQWKPLIDGTQRR